MSRELRLSQVTGYPCLWEWQDERGETEGGPILGRFSKAFMIKIVAAFLQGWHVSPWTDIRRAAACRAGSIQFPTV